MNIRKIADGKKAKKSKKEKKEKKSKKDSKEKSEKNIRVKSDEVIITYGQGVVADKKVKYLRDDFNVVANIQETAQPLENRTSKFLGLKRKSIVITG